MVKKSLTISLSVLFMLCMFAGCKLIENSSNNSQSGSSSCEHTYEWVGSEGGHQKVYTCGCLSPDIVELHRDDNGDYKCDVCGWSMTEITHLSCYEEWLDEITADDVKEIKATTEFIGVAPGRFKDIQRTTNKSVIAMVISDYKNNATMKPIAREDAEVDGGGAFTIEFILKNGEVHKLYFNNGVYEYHKPALSAFCYFEMDNIPTLKKYTNVKNSHSFITYGGTGTVYDSENNAVCEIQMNEFEFLVLEEDISMSPTNYHYTVQTEFGNLVFIQNDLFYIMEEDNRVYYNLIGKNLDERINN